jgi:hypothetical protein
LSTAQPSHEVADPLLQHAHLNGIEWCMCVCMCERMCIYIYKYMCCE